MQTRMDSALEAITNILIGAGIALLAQVIWFPLIGYHLTMTEHVTTTIFFTFVSFIRSFGIRRLFNGRSVYQSIKTRLGYE